ncbi:class I tRNA ligase family protein, partial [Patescibacteria group bacterium]
MNVNFPKTEKKILKFWKDNDIFEKSVKQRQKARKFVFYEGPPTANGRPGIHHVLSRVFKDIICRYKTMKGFKVERKAGWDTHGLPVELEVEKNLGLKNKKDIEKYGIGKFNKKCKESAWQYLKEWKKLTERIGFWMDLEDPYITYKNEYIESVWHILKEIYKKKLLFFGHKVLPYCPRCGTGLSSHEVAQGYERIKEPSIYVKLRVKNPEFKNSSLLVWTTTPWTLPGNVAVAVNPEIIYAKVKFNGESLILAKSRIEAAGLKDGEVLQEIKGKELLDLYYEAPYPIESQSGVTIYKTISADFVSLDEGTGLVHIAPAFGIDDMEAVREQNLKLRKKDLPEFPILLTVNENGRFTLDTKKWANMFVKEADPLIIENLKISNRLFKEELYEHDYPFCWRCKSPLIYYARQSWFINMQEVKADLIKNNQGINWVPSHLKNGRFGEWINEVKDWAVSRERYWATPLPIWKCKKCQNLEAIGSLNDLLSQCFSKNHYLIFRHGESLRQINNLAMSWPEKKPCPLTEKGKKEVFNSVKKLNGKKIDLIFSSDLQRTRQTAEIIAKETGAKIIFDKRLRELDVGIFNGCETKLIWDFLNKQKNIITAKIPKGESFNDIKTRVYKFLKEINEKYQHKNILIVSHEIVFTILELTLKGWSLDEIIEWKKNNRKKIIQTAEWREIEFKNLPFNEKLELDFHRPYIDSVKFYCQKCGSLTERTPEVIDCWFDSGSMPFAQAHWPFTQAQNLKLKTQKPKSPELFPADYISEAIDQTRGWFYTLLAISTLLGLESSYKNVISLGHVLDEKGEKMSKSKGNAVDPWEIIEKYGIDTIRWYFYTINQPGEPKVFSEKDVDSTLKRFILTFWNCYMFLETYGNNKKFKSDNLKSKNLKLLDKWIISRLNELTKEVTDCLERYDITSAARLLEKFVIEDLSLWYIRRSRRRFQKPKNKTELKTASAVLGSVIFNLSKLSAPFIPFFTDEIYRKIKGEKPKTRNSVHLEDWPKANKRLINKNLIRKMESLRKIITLALAERAKAKIKVRQPLKELRIKSNELKGQKDLLGLLKEEINIKEIVFDGKIKEKVKLDTEITTELKEEGTAREVIRNIQEMRKKANFKPKDNILVKFSGTLILEEILEKNKKLILKEGKIKIFGKIE